MSHIPESANRTGLDESGRRRLVVVYATLVIYALCLFAGAGTFAWPAAWAYILAGAGTTSAALVIMRDKPEIINARGRNNMPQERWDRIIMLIYTPLPLIQLALAGVDAVRLELSQMGVLWIVLGWLVYLGSMVIIYWAMASNPFLETSVRIQSDRGHRVADRGPYRYVRHPMYVGMLASLVATPLVLGSWWALIPALLGWSLMIIRTAKEDDLLQRQLAGYADYAQHVRYRLLPGLW